MLSPTLASMQSATEEELLAEMLGAWVRLEVGDARAAEQATASALDLYELGSSVDECCELTWNFVNIWAAFDGPRHISGLA
jgi:hypothetical protein